MTTKINIAQLSAYIWQPVCAFLFMWLLMQAFSYFTTSAVLGVVGATSLASSVFIVFTNPRSAPARGGNAIGGYSLGIISGVLCHCLAQKLLFIYVTIDPMSMFTLSAALAVILSLALMCALKMQHPPAAGMALGLVIEPWDFSSLGTVFVAVLILSLIRAIMKPILRPL